MSEEYDDVELHSTENCSEKNPAMDSPILPGPESGVTHQRENTKENIHVNRKDCQ